MTAKPYITAQEFIAFQKWQRMSSHQRTEWIWYMTDAEHALVESCCVKITMARAMQRRGASA